MRATARRAHYECGDAMKLFHRSDDSKLKWDAVTRLYPCEFRDVVEHYTGYYYGKCDLIKNLGYSAEGITTEDCSKCMARLKVKRRGFE